MRRTRIKRKTRHKTRRRKTGKQMRNKRRISRRRVMRGGGKIVYIPLMRTIPTIPKKPLMPKS